MRPLAIGPRGAGGFISEYHRRIRESVDRVGLSVPFGSFLIGQISPEIAYPLHLPFSAQPPSTGAPFFFRPHPLLRAPGYPWLVAASVLSAPPTRNIGLVKIPAGHGEIEISAVAAEGPAERGRGPGRQRASPRAPCNGELSVFVPALNNRGERISMLQVSDRKSVV